MSVLLSDLSAASFEEADDFLNVSIARLAAMPLEAMDLLPYGVIGFTPEGTVVVYNATESRLAGLKQDRVLGQHLFTAVAICMNNYLIAERFEQEPELDAIIPYTLTWRMRPTPVSLRLLRTASHVTRFLLIRR